VSSPTDIAEQAPAPGYPLRYRLRGGRNTHAARTINGGEGDSQITACGHMIVSRDQQQHPDQPTTCNGCIRRTKQ